jgi:hypothetical protein
MREVFTWHEVEHVVPQLLLGSSARQLSAHPLHFVSLILNSLSPLHSLHFTEVSLSNTVL